MEIYQNRNIALSYHYIKILFSNDFNFTIINLKDPKLYLNITDQHIKTFHKKNQNWIKKLTT